MHVNRQRGFYALSISVAMLVMFIVAIGLARSNVNQFKVTTGQIAGNQLSRIATGLSSYISTNNTALINNTAIDGVATSRSPTLSELQALGFLSTNLLSTPTYGGSYKISISVTPTDCTVSTCTVVGQVYLSDPIYTSEGNSVDIRILGAAVTNSSSSNIGFSTPSDPTVITGPGWTLTNPDSTQRAGILLATTSVNSNTNQQYWLKSVSNIDALPTSGNNLGDGRLTQDKNKPYSWNGTSWNVGTYGEYGSNWANLYMGYNAAGSGGSVGNLNNIVGAWAGYSNTTGSKNNFYGYKAGSGNTSGNSNNYYGAFAGSDATTGNYNSAFGDYAGSTITGSSNTLLGASAGLTTTGSNNIVVGGVKSVKGSYNVLITCGQFSWLCYSGINSSNSVVIGSRALYDINSNYTANGVVAVGALAASSYTGYYENPNVTAVGYNASIGNQWVSNNTSVGANSGSSNNLLSYATSIGANAVASANNSTALGYGAIASASNSIVLGNTQVTSIGGSVAFTNSSDRRLKRNIKGIDDGLGFINKLNPVTFDLISSGAKGSGFIAQEVEQVDPLFSGVKKPRSTDDYYGITYTDFIAPMVKSIQQLDAKINKMAADDTHSDDAELLSTLKFFYMIVFALTLLLIYLFVSLVRLNKKVKILLLAK
jgi:hypothetical protein